MNKISPHIIDWNNDVLDFIRLAKPAFAKVMVPQGHDTMKLARAKELSPNTKWICRLYADEQPLEFPRQDAELFGAFLDSAGLWDYYDIFEGYNEPPPYGPDDWKRINEFEATLAQIVHGAGKEYCAFNWSNGQPPYEAWFHLLDAIRVADYIGIHSYGWPGLRDCEGLALRHRTLPRTGKPIILTEFGFTELVANPQGEDVGWRKWDVHPWGARQYRCIEELAWMADRLAEDDYVLGACYFVTGRLRGDQWLTHDLTPRIYKKIAGYVAQPNSQDGSNDSGGGGMDIWENVPPQIAQWKKLVGRVTSDYPVPIPDYQGVAVSPAKVVACIIRRESNGDPNIVNPDSGATGLMQIMPFHFEEGQDPKDPDWNVRKGLSIFEDKITKSNDLLVALFWYSGKAGRPGGPFLEDYWLPFVAWYEQFWGVDLEPGEVDYKKKYEGLKNGVVAAINTLQAVLDA